MSAKVLLYFLTLIFLIFLVTFLLKIKSKCDLLKTSDTDVVYLELQTFHNYIKQFNKTYSAQEYKERLDNFKASLEEIARLNALEKDAVFGLTKFSDMSAQEFEEKMLMKRSSGNCVSYNSLCFETSYNASLDSSTPLSKIEDKIDWREKGVIGPVQDQRHCKGCWAVGLAGVMESMANIKRKSNQVLSIQEILDCLVDKNQDGCNGGNVASSLVILCNEHQNVVTAERYPFTLKREKCKLRKKDKGVKLKSFVYRCIRQTSVRKSEENMQRDLMNGPVTAVVNAAIWRFYLGGIIRRACVRSDSSSDHVIQVVGFDRTSEVPHYILKNSWGESFGDHGYVKIEMYKNMCGIAEEVGIIDVL
ncbi:unnamed protein product [Arctia plantaginis]|uniref:Uncharacterized protein n=1 Tax=Arctia plantaginis TaxID=874455 RepID=A0A8S0Z4B7_ARCPL|nr:unnamed protein product [Arctia plantaginis]